MTPACENIFSGLSCYILHFLAFCGLLQAAWLCEQGFQPSAQTTWELTVLHAVPGSGFPWGWGHLTAQQLMSPDLPGLSFPLQDLRALF